MSGNKWSLGLFLILFVLGTSATLEGWTTNVPRRSRQKTERQQVLERDEAEQLYQTSTEYFIQDNYFQVIKTADQLLALFPRSRYADDALYLKAASLLKENRCEDARIAFNKLILEYPRSNVVDEARLGLGDSFYLAENFDLAVEAYHQFIIENSKSPVLAAAYFKLGKSYQKKGRWSEAEYYFGTVAQDYPLSFEASQASGILAEGSFYFTIQVGSFRDAENARKIYQKLKNKNYQVYLSELQKEGKILYRVRVGQFDTRREADYIAKLLKKEGYLTKIYP